MLRSGGDAGPAGGAGADAEAGAGWVGVAIYMSLIMLVSLVTAVRMPETRGRDLRLEADA